MTEKRKGFLGKLVDRLDEKLEKKSREKGSCDCGESEDIACYR